MSCLCVRGCLCEINDSTDEKTTYFCNLETSGKCEVISLLPSNRIQNLFRLVLRGKAHLLQIQTLFSITLFLKKTSKKKIEI